MVAGGDQVGDAAACDAEGLFQEADYYVGCRPDRVEDVARVNDEIHFPLQDGVNGPSVSLLDVDLALVTARLGMELRVPGVPQVRIRDVRYAYYVPAILPRVYIQPLLATPTAASVS